MILKMAIFDKLDDIDIEPELMGSLFYFMIFQKLYHNPLCVLAEMGLMPELGAAVEELDWM